MDQTLIYCLENNLPKAVDFEPVLLSLRQAALDPTISKKEVLNLQNSKYKSNHKPAVYQIINKFLIDYGNKNRKPL